MLDDKSYIIMTLVNQKSHSNVQTGRILFTWIFIRSLEEHKQNRNWKQTSEISCAFSYVRSQMTKMHWCYSNCVSVSLERHCCWPSPSDRDYLYSGFLTQCHHSQSFCLEYGVGYTILSAFYFVQTLLSIQFSTQLEWQLKALSCGFAL